MPRAGEDHSSSQSLIEWASAAYDGSFVRIGWNHQEARVLETPTAEGLLRAERRLQAAQLAGDLVALDRLLDDRLVAIGPDGSRYSKDDDLAGHRTGSSVVSDLVEEHVEVLVAGTTGVTFFIGTVSGTFEGQPMSARLRYTRTWVHDGGLGWRILAAHIAVLPAGA